MPVKVCLNTLSAQSDVEDRILGTIYGQCIGNAIGLLTTYMPAANCKKVSMKFYCFTYFWESEKLHDKYSTDRPIEL